MEEEYGAEKGEEVFYASKNKGTISGVDSMSVNIADIAEKLDAAMGRWDSFMARRQARKDAKAARKDAKAKAKADAQQRKDAVKAAIDAFEEASHPRNANGVFTTGEGEEGKEDSQMDPGKLSKRDPL